MRQREQARERDDQNWERLADRVPERFSKHGDLERWSQAQDATLDRHVAESAAKRDRLDAIIRELKDRHTAIVTGLWKREQFARTSFWCDVLDALGPNPSDATIAIYGALFTILNDEARRLSGAPELRVARTRKDRDEKFGSLSASVGFSAGELGLGPVNLVIAEQRDEHRRERALVLHRGRLPVTTRVRDRVGNVTRYASAGGYLPVEWMPVKESRGGVPAAKGAAAIETEADVDAAVRASGISQEDLELLRLVQVGEWQKVPGKKRIGDETGKDGRGHGQTWLVKLTAKDLAERWPELGSVEVIRHRLQRAREALQKVLEKRGMVPKQEEPRKRRERETTPRPELCAKW